MAAPFKKGAFYLPKHLAAPIVVLWVFGTHRLFPPGHFAFQTWPIAAENSGWSPDRAASRQQWLANQATIIWRLSEIE